MSDLSPRPIAKNLDTFFEDPKPFCDELLALLKKHTGGLYGFTMLIYPREKSEATISLTNTTDEFSREAIVEYLARSKTSACKEGRAALVARLENIKTWADQALTAVHDTEIIAAFEQISDEADLLKERSES